MFTYHILRALFYVTLCTIRIQRNYVLLISYCHVGDVMLTAQQTFRNRSENHPLPMNQLCIQSGVGMAGRSFQRNILRLYPRYLRINIFGNLPFYFIFHQTYVRYLYKKSLLKQRHLVYAVYYSFDNRKSSHINS